MQLARARATVDYVVANATGPVSVFVADAHGELVAAVTMDGAAPDTRLNAQRKAYTAARSDASSTRELAEKARADPVERARFDPFFTFFLGGVAVFGDGRRVSKPQSNFALNPMSPLCPGNEPSAEDARKQHQSREAYSGD